jgi:hypothetical protein
MRPTICSLFEPHYKQNLYTNPKRTAKSFIALLNRYNSAASCSKNIFFSKSFTLHCAKCQKEFSRHTFPRFPNLLFPLNEP